MKELIPKRRFAGFTDPWEQHNLDRKVEFYSGLTYSPKDVENEGTFVLRSSNVQNGELVDADNVYVNPEVVNSCNVKEGDIIVVVRNGSRSLIGKHAQIKSRMDNTVIGAFMTGVRSEQSNFINALMDTQQFYKEIEKNLGATINQITNRMFSEMTFMFTSEEEQVKIGNFFANLDNLITLHQRKLEKLKDSKAAYLSEMFPKEGEVYPKRRFAGFTDPWEQRKLGDMGDTFTGLSGKTKEDFGKGEAEFITYLNVFNNPISNIKLTGNVELDKKQNEVRYGDILFTTSSETPEEVGMSSVWMDNRKNVYLNSFCFGYRLRDKIDPFYMAYSLRSNPIRYQFILLAQGISRYNISKTKAMDIKVMLPKLSEQIRIGEFFSNIDNLITLHQRKLEKLQALKQAYLSEMFI